MGWPTRYRNDKKWKIVLFICWVVDTQLDDLIFGTLNLHHLFV